MCLTPKNYYTHFLSKSLWAHFIFDIYLYSQFWNKNFSQLTFHECLLCANNRFIINPFLFFKYLTVVLRRIQENMRTHYLNNIKREDEDVMESDEERKKWAEVGGTERWVKGNGGIANWEESSRDIGRGTEWVGGEGWRYIKGESQRELFLSVFSFLALPLPRSLSLFIALPSSLSSSLAVSSHSRS